MGVVDTGVFSTQTQLQPADFNDGMSSGRTLLNMNESGSSTFSDECNHGTRIASTIAAPRDGVNMVGVAWMANLVTVKHGDDVFIDMIETDAVTRAIRAAAQHGARIIEMAFEHGVLFLGCGPSTVRLCPPLIVTKEEADVAVDVLEECIRKVGA